MHFLFPSESELVLFHYHLYILLEAFWVFFRSTYLQGDILPITHEKTAIANYIKGSESSHLDPSSQSSDPLR